MPSSSWAMPPIPAIRSIPNWPPSCDKPPRQSRWLKRPNGGRLSRSASDWAVHWNSCGLRRRPPVRKVPRRLISEYRVSLCDRMSTFRRHRTARGASATSAPHSLPIFATCSHCLSCDLSAPAHARPGHELCNPLPWYPSNRLRAAWHQPDAVAKYI